jgi:hypothetical protein
MYLIIKENKVVGQITGFAPEVFAELNPGQTLVENTFGVVNPLGYEYANGAISQGVGYVAPPVQQQFQPDPLAMAKVARAKAVDNIVVTVNGKSFDGDETSQTRMARAIIALQATNTPTIRWVLHDNTAAIVTVAELVQALALSGAEQSALWVIA